MGWLDRQRLRKWLSVGANARALARAQAQWSALDTIAAADLPATRTLRRWRSQHPGPSRVFRPALAGGLALATMVLMIGPPLATRVQADARTGAGEQRDVVLEDGSRIRLNTASAVEITYSQGRRIVRLLEGEAMFEVMPDDNRPFVVEAAGGRVTALGTVFVVRRKSWTQGGGGVASGIEHAISVQSGDGQVRLTPGQTSEWPMGGRPGAARPIRDPNATQWARGALTFERQPLVKVAAELDRYTSDRIVVIGAVRTLKVNGVSTPSRPLDALLALESGRHIEVTRIPGLIVVRAPPSK